MAIRVYNGTDWDSILALPTAPTISSSGTNLSTSVQAGPTYTAPNTTNAVTGCLLYVSTVPTSGDVVLTLYESGVATAATVTVPRTSLAVGFNYVRLATPYVFTTTAANAYAWRISKTTGTNGVVARDGSLPMLIITTNQTGAIGASDDAVVCGFLDGSGLTAKTLTITGTSNSWGSGTDRSMASTTNRTLGAALAIGNGGTVAWDTAASAKLKLLGSVIVTRGGTLDCTAHASDVTKVATLEINNDSSSGQFGVMSASGDAGGAIKFQGAVVAPSASYSSGTGTTINPVVTSAAHNFKVDDELIFGGASDYLKNEIRYVKSIPSSTQLVLSSTPGGAESALAQTHAAGSRIANLTRNCVVKPTTTTRGPWIFYSQTNSATASKLSYTRTEYANCASGKGITIGASSTPNLDGWVLYHNDAAGRASLTLQGALDHTISDICMVNPRGTNYAGSSGVSIASGKNKTIDGLLVYSDPGAATACAAVSFSSAVNCVIRDMHTYGCNASNTGVGYAVGLFTSAGNRFEDCTINASRVRAIYMSGGTDTVFDNVSLGGVATNTIDIYLVTDTLNTALFTGCSFGSATLLSNYLNALEGSEIAMFEMDGSADKHRWYTNHGSAWSSGSGLSDTTTRTANSLAVALKPEDATDGFSWSFQIPANPDSQCQVFGYGYRNATFSSGDFTVELYLPGSSSPDASYTLPTTTQQWLPFNVSALYEGSKARYATVVITAKTATAGAYAFVDDLYDAGTANKVAGLDLWYEGKPSQVMVANDYSVVPALVWGYPASGGGAGTMGAKLRSLLSTALFIALKDKKLGG